MATSPAKPAEAAAPAGAKLAAVPSGGMKTVTPAAVPPAKAPPTRYKVAPPARPARLRRRHVALAGTFLLMVVLPAAVAAWYLWTRAVDQYASYAGFSVQREEAAAPVELIGGITAIGGASASSDPEILYEFLTSQALVAELEADLGLSEIWSAPRDADPVFAYDPSGTVEDLLDHWGRMVQIGFDGGTGLLELRVLAFEPEDATMIADAILDRSSTMINALSDAARADATAYAEEELAEALDRLRAAREAVTRFRLENRIVDPSLDIQTSAGLQATLEAQLAEALIELDLLRDTAGEGDPRVQSAQRRIAVIEARIEAERDRMGSGVDDAVAMADVVGEFERLTVDREYAELAYTGALAGYDAARAEARRKSRYLATHVPPTTAETSRYPRRGMLLSLLIGFSVLAWMVLVLVGYSLRDRR